MLEQLVALEAHHYQYGMLRGEAFVIIFPMICFAIISLRKRELVALI